MIDDATTGTIGLIGGMSWESTVVYYQLINRAVRDRLGGLHSARILMESYDFDEIAGLQRANRWDTLAERLASSAKALERAGAGCIAICTNTMHKVAPHVRAAAEIPLIDIRDAAGAAIQKAGFRTVGLLGTRYTMEQDFLRGHLERKWGIEALVPPPAEHDLVHSVIFDELCQGIVRAESRSRIISIMESLAARGARGIVLGCTELMLLLSSADSVAPLFDTTLLHAEALAAYALDNRQTIVPTL